MSRGILAGVGGGLLSLLLAWHSGPRVVGQDAAFARRGGAAEGCTQLDCSDTTCGKHCSVADTGTCTHISIETPSQCGTGAGNSCKSLSTTTCEEPCIAA